MQGQQYNNQYPPQHSQRPPGPGMNMNMNIMNMGQVGHNMGPNMGPNMGQMVAQMPGQGPSPGSNMPGGPSGMVQGPGKATVMNRMFGRPGPYPTPQQMMSRKGLSGFPPGTAQVRNTTIYRHQHSSLPKTSWMV